MSSYSGLAQHNKRPRQPHISLSIPRFLEKELESQAQGSGKKYFKKELDMPRKHPIDSTPVQVEKKIG